MNESRAAIAGEDYATALEIFEEANREYEFVLVDYAIARAYHMMGRYEEAELAYDSFLNQRRGCDDPHGLEALATTYRQEAQIAREEAAQQIAVIDTLPESDDSSVPPSQEPSPEPIESTVDEELLDDATALEADANADTPSPETVDETLALTDVQDEDSGGIDLGWYFIGGGSALVLAGVIFDITQADLVDQRLAAQEEGDLEEFLQLDDAIQRGRWVEGVLYGVGIAAVGTGVLLLVLQDDEKADAVSLGVSPARGGGAFVTYGGLF